MNCFKKIMAFALAFATTSTFTISIVTVKGSQVIKESQRGIAINEKLQKEEKRLTPNLNNLRSKLEKKEAEILKKQKALNEKAKEFEKSAPLLSDEAKQRKFESLQEEKRVIDEEASELQRLGRKYNAEAQRVKEKLDKLNEKELVSFNDEIKETIEEAANEFNWDIVLMEESVVFSSKKVNKTKVVIDRLNKKEEKRIKMKIAKDRKEIEKDKKQLLKDQSTLNSFKSQYAK